MKRYVNGDPLKRFGAFILDVLMIVFVSTILYSIIGKALVNTRAFSEANQIMNEILVESYLYEYDESDPNITKVVSEEKFEVVIKKYYVEVKQNEELYHEKMNSSNLFNLIDGEYEKREGVSDEDVINFYKEMMGEAIIEVKQNENYQFCYRLSLNFVIYNIIVSFLISYFAFIVFVPFAFKNRTTIGQRVMNLAIVDIESNKFATKTQIFFRSIIILLIEVLLSIFSFGVPILISFGFVLFNKNKCSYHDILSSTKVIDYHYVELDDSKNDNAIKM